MDSDKEFLLEARLTQERTDPSLFFRLNETLWLPSLGIDSDRLKIAQTNINDMLPSIDGRDGMGEQKSETAFAPTHPVGGAAHIGQRGDVRIIRVKNDRQIEPTAPQGPDQTRQH